MKNMLRILFLGCVGCILAASMASAVSTEIHNKVLVSSLKDPINITDTYESGYIDCSKYESAEIIISVGLSADTLSGTDYGTFSLEECATSGGTYTDVADADVIYSGGTNDIVIDSMSEDNAVYKIAYIGDARYVHVQWTEAGTLSSGMPQSIVAVQGNARHAPVS